MAFATTSLQGRSDEQRSWDLQLGVYLSRPGDTANAGCVVVTLPSTMGGGTQRRCGADAVSFCRAEGPRNATIAAACRREGYLENPG